MLIDVTLGFMWQGKEIEAGSRLEVPHAFGRELIGMHKAVAAVAEIPAAVASVTDAADKAEKSKKATP
jgi:hypothetical protein